MRRVSDLKFGLRSSASAARVRGAGRALGCERTLGCALMALVAKAKAVAAAAAAAVAAVSAATSAFVAAVAATALVWSPPSAAALSLLEEGSHCVAYRVQLVRFFVNQVAVVGRNCDVAAQVLPEVGGLYHIEVNIPVRSFQSGDLSRDKDVSKILKAEQRAEITFKTTSLSAEQWRKVFAQKTFLLEGDITIGDKTFPLKVTADYQMKSEGAEVDGLGNIQFSDLGLRPPVLLGGMVARVKSDLELHFHLVSQRILGANSIRIE
jgi:hypothetical protein